MRSILPILTLCLLLPLARPATARVTDKGPDTARAVRSSMEPTYPILAMNMHVEGEVTVVVMVSAEGRPISAHATAGHPLLNPAAESCVMRWRFAPSQETSAETVHFHFAIN